MYYITARLPVMYREMSFEDFLNNVDVNTTARNLKEDATRTWEVEKLSEKALNVLSVDNLISRLQAFNEYYKYLREVNRDELYTHFKIPKRKGGFRKIDAPKSELDSALRSLMTILEVDFGALYHTSAFAYIHNRSTLTAVKKHQFNDSRWFAKYDLSNFFGSTTLEFVMHMLGMIYPFCEVIKNPKGKAELEKALDLAFLNGGLPQGTPLSPMLTNLMMIPIDFKLTKTLRDYKKQQFVYTRYADDFFISSKYDFDYRDIENLLVKTLHSFGAPFKLNIEKTRYGSRNGRNWMLGVMLNQDNHITVGYKKKKQFQNSVNQYVKDKLAGNDWDISDVQHLEGMRSYYTMVEGETIDKIMQFLSNKHGVDIVAMIKNDLK